ncbi:hypothetical protein AXG93_1952s1100 [Marchantia polymorpha subsp. ruderalis]|uniref:F-box domain-containing protein n=1 Tax=Marchantia polymorpha subsp. ruderalis TaxID=1480154 RepID=A0A176WM41_MARPO|nr:hypothetical protein AXG93_1952s1100 [Marchantia polymorpha subsp. ruderalis]
MEARLWSDLPEDLTEKVLTKLPVSGVLRLRAICKAWNSLILSRNLLSLCREEPSPTPCLLGTSADCESFVGYNPSSRKWFDLCLTFPDPALRPRVYLAASAGGLLCFAATIDEVAAFFVCNPTTRSWRQLPPPALKVLPRVSFGHHLDLATCMLFDESSRHYKIVVVGNATSGWYRITQIYDSCTGSWKRLGGAIPQDVDFRSYGLVCKGHIYYMMAGLSIKVMSMNVDAGLWSKLEAPLPRFLVRPRLVERGGSLLLVGGVHKYWRQGWNSLKPQSVRIWELDQINMVWVEIGRMPEDVHSHFVATLGHETQDFKCAGLGQLMFFTSRCSWGFSLVMFNFLTREWTWIPYPEKMSLVDDVLIFQAMGSYVCVSEREIERNLCMEGFFAWHHPHHDSSSWKPKLLAS